MNAWEKQEQEHLYDKLLQKQNSLIKVSYCIHGLTWGFVDKIFLLSFATGNI